MGHFHPLYFVFVAISICEAVSSVEDDDCQAEALIASNHNGSETETTMESWGNDTVMNPCGKRLHLQLCCPIGSIMNSSATDIDECVAVDNSSVLKLPPHYDPSTLEERPGQLRFHDFKLASRNNCANLFYWLEPEEHELDTYKLLANGSIYLPLRDQIFNATDYCFGAVTNTSFYQIILCGLEENDANSDIIIFIQVVWFISFLSLLVTFVVYSVIPDLRNMHGATLRAYVGQLLVHKMVHMSMIFQLLDQFSGHVMLSVMLFSGLAVYFWLNVMCFDIWWTFGRASSLKNNMGRWKRKQFIIYAVYVWGSSLLFTTIIVMAFSFYNGSSQQLTYIICVVFIPVGLTLVCNLCFFVLTAKTIIQQKKAAAQHLQGQDSHRHDDKMQWFNIYFKLFVVMGLDKSVLIIGWIYDYRSDELWIIVQLIEHLQGILICVIFVCKQKIWQKFVKSFDCLSRCTTYCYCGVVTREESERK